MLRLLSFWLQKFYLVLFADSIPRKVVKGTVVAEKKKPPNNSNKPDVNLGRVYVSLTEQMYRPYTHKGDGQWGIQDNNEIKTLKTTWEANIQHKHGIKLLVRDLHI